MYVHTCTKTSISSPSVFGAKRAPVAVVPLIVFRPRRHNRNREPTSAFVVTSTRIPNNETQDKLIIRVTKVPFNGVARGTNNFALGTFKSTMTTSCAKIPFT